MTDIKQATRDLMTAIDQGHRVICLHYGCENFNDVKDRPVAVSAIGVAELTDPSGERESQVFSIANSQASEDPVERERDMMRRFFEFAKARPDASWVHWNMNNATYGFSALLARYRYILGEDPPKIFPSDRLYDLDSIIGARYGERFVRHPKLRNLCSLNGYFMPGFKNGKDEAEAFASGDYGLCERSTGEKAHLLASILTSFRSGALLTANSVGMVEFAHERLDAVKVVLALGDRFLYVQRELEHRRSGRPTLKVGDEYDAQDLMRSLLAIFFGDVRAEDAAPIQAGAASRVDFVLPDFELAVELKFARDSMSSKSLGEELVVDRERYTAKPGVRHLLCLVFDHDGKLRNPRGLERDLSRDASSEAFAVTVRIYDR
jgi:hypothetical protein